MKIANCHLCNDSFWVFNLDGSVKRCSCFENEKTKRRLSFANIPEAFKDYNLSNFTIKAYEQVASKKTMNGIRECIKAYMESLDKQLQDGKGLYLYSDTKGSGKTRLITSICNELIKNHSRQVKFCTSIAILNEIKATWKRESEYSESKLLDDLINAEILVIDDFGTEEPRDWVKEKFYHIINERYISKKATFYTSNYSLEELRHDDRVTNRIKECSYQLHFPEESIRDHIAKSNVENLLKAMGNG